MVVELLMEKFWTTFSYVERDCYLHSKRVIKKKKRCRKKSLFHATIAISRKVIWDMINIHCSVAVELTLFAFLQHSQTYIYGLLRHSFKFLRRTINSKSPTIPFGIFGCTFSDNLFKTCTGLQYNGRIHLHHTRIKTIKDSSRQMRHLYAYVCK